MGDERVEMLANKVANLVSSTFSQQQTLKELQEMMPTLHAHMDHIAGNRNGDHGESSHRRTNHSSMGSGGTLIPKVTKLDFPRFNGRDDLTSWICRSEQFFEFQNIPNEEWISLAAYHLEGETQLWYKLLKSEREIT
ncbi:Retrovirus-related Pol polyprotein from transposon 297 [Fagus crenata]